ncbi:cytochrome P450 [Polymorphobacter multimanifer]|uniref:Cytochrome P450 n=1 Tax=Polymorphobacter multimanifer TaxID=1070431 RepID=A0A841L7J3_9SPHN|nr:cytochrome P450 [Polymorphobacter multimanifer]MBB6228969.1 cytochrome P450 [Polymorphobacter multimanifer]GGI73638.1 cytochrome P450 [Polymorphobacter multimanifer]
MPSENLVFDPRDPDVIQQPLKTLLRLQADDPVHWSPLLKGWVLTRHDDVKAVQLNQGISSDRLTPFFENQPGAEQAKLRDLVHYLNTWVAFKDPPDHTRLRGLLNKVVTPGVMRGLEEGIAELADGLLDRIAARGDGRFECISEFANPLPASVIMDLLGVPRGDMNTLRDWSMLLQPFLGNATASDDKYESGRAGIVAMADYFRDAVADRQRRPRENVISHFVSLQQAGQISDDEVIGSCILFLFAGHETTTNLIGNGIRALLANPEQKARLVADSGLIAGAVEEMLRYEGPTGAVVRVVKAPFELRGKMLKAGDRVFAMVNAANHDPLVFEAPERFDIGRTPNRHLTFNHGIHFCLGAPLARSEGRIAIGRFLARFPDAKVESDTAVYMDTLTMRGVRDMWMLTS